MTSDRFGLSTHCHDQQSPLCGSIATHRGPGCVNCHVRHLTICGGFEPEELRYLEPLVGHRDLTSGQSLFDEEDKANYAYNLVEGTIRLYKLLPDGRRQITGFAIPGDFLGLSSRGHYAYSAEAVSGASLCRFKLTDLQNLFKRFPAMEHRVLAIANDELAAAQDQMLLLGRKTPIEKVTSFLLTLSRRLERVGRQGDQFAISLRLDHDGRRGDQLLLAMTRADIADYLGLTVETVSRTFSKLKSARMIALPTPDQVQLLDRRRLESVAAGDAA